MIKEDVKSVSKSFKGDSYALSLGKPIWRRTCRGEREALESFVGVGFFLGGS